MSYWRLGSISYGVLAAACSALVLLVTTGATDVQAQSAGAPVQSVECLAETSELKRDVSALNVEWPTVRDFAAGDRINIRWRGAPKVAIRTPLFLIITLPEDVRFSIEQATSAVRTSGPASKASASAPVGAGLGFLAVPPLGRAPLNLATGKGRMRAIVPLHLPGSAAAGTFGIKGFRAGTLDVTWQVVAMTGCGEQAITARQSLTYQISPASPHIVIQDEFDIDKPKDVIVSNSGRYRLEVFDGRYRVRDAATGAKLIERPGREPNFSPTGRFVAATVQRSISGMAVVARDHMEVIDLTSGEALPFPGGYAPLWLNGDSFLGSMQDRPSSFAIYSTLVDGFFSMDAPNLCHGCSARWSTKIRFDVDNGIVLFLGSSPQETDVRETLYEMASFRRRDFKRDGEAVAYAAQTYAVVPFAAPKAWDFGEPIRLSHGPKGLKHGENTTLPDLSTLVVRHNIGSAIARATIQTAGSDWRLARSTKRNSDLIASKSMNEQLAGLGLPLLDPDPVTEFVGEATRKWSMFGNVARTEPSHAKQAQQQRVADFPGQKPPVTGGGEATAEESDIGSWRWVVGGKPLWLDQYLTVEGARNFKIGEVFLSRGGNPELIDWVPWEGDPGTTYRETMLSPSLYRGRYLVVGTSASAGIVVYDLGAKRPLARFQGIPQAQLLARAALTADLRHLVQINRDGQFFVHRMDGTQSVLAGRFVDEEVILYTPEGYYASSYEGAHFVHLRFPGQSGQFSFHQFAKVLHRPDVVRAVLAGQPSPRRPQLTLPPSVTFSVVAAEQKLVVRYSARAAAGLKELRLYQDGMLTNIDKFTGTVSAQSFEVARAANARRISLVAVDSNGYISQPATTVLPAAPPSQISPRKLFVVSVGVDQYTPDYGALNFAKIDSATVAAAAEAQRGRYYGSVDVRSLKDNEANPKGVMAAVEAVVASAGPTDTIMFFFAGHGERTVDGRFYMITSATRRADLSGTALDWLKLGQALAHSRARVLVVIDACHSGQTGPQSAATNDDVVASLSSAGKAPIVVLAASKGRQESLENETAGGGVFTQAFAKIITTDRTRWDRNKDGLLDLSELYVAVKDLVMEQTKQQQTPWLIRQEMVGDFPLF